MEVGRKQQLLLNMFDLVDIQNLINCCLRTAKMPDVDAAHMKYLLTLTDKLEIIKQATENKPEVIKRDDGMIEVRKKGGTGEKSNK